MSIPDQPTAPGADPATKLHPDFEEGDVTFVSNDGVELRVSGKKLAKGSDVFRDMSDLPQTNGPEEKDGDARMMSFKPVAGKPIYLGYTAAILESFLVMFVCPIPMIPPTNFEETCEIYKLLFKYECADKLIEMARMRLVGSGKQHIQKVLQLASSPGIDDWHLGRLVLVQLNDGDPMDLFNVVKLKKLPPA
ncbi:hypothetical protein IAT40_000891 [Kwoniella sp. CBS 6097]